MSILQCPSCQTALLTLNKPCYKCGMLFIPDLECPSCHKMEHEHLRNCPPRERDEKPRQICPLCNGKLHRHEVESSKFECLWRQCFSGKAGYDVESNGVPTLNEITSAEFASWLSGFDTPPQAGTVDAQRILRQRKRASDGNTRKL